MHLCAEWSVKEGSEAAGKVGELILRSLPVPSCFLGLGFKTICLSAIIRLRQLRAPMREEGVEGGKRGCGKAGQSALLFRL